MFIRALTAVLLLGLWIPVALADPPEGKMVYLPYMDPMRPLTDLIGLPANLPRVKGTRKVGRSQSDMLHRSSQQATSAWINYHRVRGSVRYFDLRKLPSRTISPALNPCGRDVFIMP